MLMALGRGPLAVVWWVVPVTWSNQIGEPLAKEIKLTPKAKSFPRLKINPIDLETKKR
jgi:hypothetical protein